MSKFYKAICAGLAGAALLAAPAMAVEGHHGGGGSGAKAGGVARSAPSGGAASFNGSPNRHFNRTPSNRLVVRERTTVRTHVVRPAHREGGHNWRRGTRYLWGGLPFYFYDGYYYGDCSWLRRRAEATGSRYWWVRYRQCREAD